MRRFILRFLSVTSVVLAVSCGSNPLSPAGAGVTINGSVVGSASSAGMNVSPTNGGGSATVDMGGRFTLNNVGAGSNVSLNFRGAGVNTQVALGAISANDRVTVKFTRDGADMHLDSINCQGADKEELEGRIDGLPPTTPAGTFTIGGQNVQTDANTVIKRGDSSTGTFADLVLGMRVHVKGTPNAGGVLAKIITIQNVNVDLGFEIEGTISGLTGTSASFQFMLDGKLIKGDSTTTFDGGKTFADLANGVSVEVKAQIKVGFLQATRIEFE